jgi:hypothetical protein
MPDSVLEFRILTARELNMVGEIICDGDVNATVTKFNQAVVILTKLKEKIETNSNFTGKIYLRRSKRNVPHLLWRRPESKNYEAMTLSMCWFSKRAWTGFKIFWPFPSQMQTIKKIELERDEKKEVQPQIEKIIEQVEDYLFNETDTHHRYFYRFQRDPNK